MLTKHPNFYGELSYHISTVTREGLYRFLLNSEQFFVPLEKLIFGTDYPGFLYDPVELRDKLLGVNEEAAPARHPRDPAARSSTASSATTSPASWACSARLSNLVMGAAFPIAEWGRWWLYWWTHAGRAARRADSEL